MNTRFVSTLVAVALLAISAQALADRPLLSFGFKPASVRGATSGEVVLGGGGAYRPGGSFVQASGSFSCSADIAQGPLAGCRAGEGVRWTAARLLPSANVGDPSAAGTVANTGDGTVVILAKFFRAGDPEPAPVMATVIVSSTDLDPNAPGTQNLWVEGVGFGSAEARFQ